MRRQILTTVSLAALISLGLNGGGQGGIVPMDSAMAYAGFTQNLPNIADKKPYERAKALIRAGRIDEAESILGEIESQYPELSQYFYLLRAEVQLAASDTKEAIALFETAANGKAKFVAGRATLRLAEVEMSSGRFEAAGRHYRKLSQDAEASAAAEFEIEEARALIAAKQNEKAIESLRSILTRRVKPEAKMKAATILLKQGAFRGDNIEKAADIFYAGGDFATAAALYKDAYKSVARITETQKRRSSILFQMGRSQERADKFRAAIKTYKELLNNYPVHADPIQVRYHIGLCFQRIGKDAIGEQYFNYILKKAPSSKYADDVLYRIAARRDSKDKRAEALALYRRLLKEYPKSSWCDVAAWHSGFSFFEDGNLSEAEAAFDRALRAYPNSDYAGAMGYWRGRILEKMGDSRAAEQYQNVIRNNSHRYYRGRAAIAFRRVGGVVTQQMIDEALKRAEEGKVKSAISDLAAIWELGSADVSQQARTEMKKLASSISHWSALSRFSTAPLDEAALTFDAGDAPHLKTIASLIEVGAYELAAQELSDMETRKDWRPERRLAKARVLAEGGEFRKAIREVERLADELGTVHHPAAMPDVMAGLLYPRFYSQIVEAEAKKYDLDPRFVLAVIREESRFDQGIASWAGAQGLMQIMPATGASIARNLKIDSFKREQLQDPNVNIAMGVYYLNRMKRLYDGRDYLALSGYNAGPGNTSRWVRQNPTLEEEIWIEKIAFKETRNYVKKVLGSFWTYKKLDGEVH